MKLKDLLIYKKQLVTEAAKHAAYVHAHNNAEEDRPIEMAALKTAQTRWNKYLTLVNEIINVKNILDNANTTTGIAFRLNAIAENKSIISTLQGMNGDDRVIERSTGYQTPNKEVKVFCALTADTREQMISVMELKIAEYHAEIEALNFSTEVECEKLNFQLDDESKW